MMTLTLWNWMMTLLDNFMASTAQAGKTRGVDPKHLSKICRISHEDAQRTIDVTTQMSM